MKIYINSYNEIKALHSSDDTSLIEIEVDRGSVFGSMSDFIILHYKYIPDETGYSICPSINYDKLLYLENKEIIKESQDKINILTNEINELKAFNTQLIKSLNINAIPLI